MQLKFPKNIVEFVKGLRETTYGSCLWYLSNFSLAIGYNALLLYALVWEAGNIVNLPTKRIGFYNFCLWNQKAELDCLMIKEIEKLGISNVALVLSRLCVYISPVLCLFSASTIVQQAFSSKDRDGWKLAQILLSVTNVSLPVGLILFIFSTQKWIQVSELSEGFAALVGAYILLLLHLLIISLYLAKYKNTLHKRPLTAA
ncbi:transmembrane protein 140 [Notechis scutatus]|uniref:Transmembrane protein 140 n=1 Tax=Notechis scutatus TaxID=8663 RepID=A0A6J1W4E9_9SAUR|nr:transmembrane protein 140 [Notechis scutatus]XP_026550197.1 transmembrane protein 140 [Notechis scutatus]